MAKTKPTKKSKAKPAAAKKAAAGKRKTAPKKAAAKSKPVASPKKAAARRAAASMARKPAASAAPAVPTADVAKAFTDALKSGQFEQAEALWSDDVVSYEAQDGPMKEVRGRKGVHEKGVWWQENFEIHSFDTEGPMVNGDAFVLRFKIDATEKATGNRNAMDEIAIYKVKGGKVVEERFFY